MRVVFTRRYLQELESISDAIAQHDPVAAARIVNEIHTKASRLLSAHPFIGRPGEISGTRELVIVGTAYVLAYRVVNEQVEVLFVQHGARAWPDAIE